MKVKNPLSQAVAETDDEHGRELIESRGWLLYEPAPAAAAAPSKPATKE